MGNQRKYETIKEKRESYFVEYFPPSYQSRYSHLQLVIINVLNLEEIANAMEIELVEFLNRYPIPIMVSSFDKTGQFINLETIRPCSCLLGFFNKDNEITSFWRLLRDEEIPGVAFDQDYINGVFSELTYKTFDEKQKEILKRRKQVKEGWFIFFIWLVIIPAIIALLVYHSNFLSLIALIYSLYKAIKKGLELTNKWPKSKRIKEQENKERLKEHYYYHCELNPEGFNKLKIENLEKMGENEIRKEFETL